MVLSKSTRLGAAVVVAAGLAAAGGAYATAKLTRHGQASPRPPATGAKPGNGLGGGRLGLRGFGFNGPGLSGGYDLATAASYLDVSANSLLQSLRSGKTLGELANATSGKSAAGLIGALVSQERSSLASSVEAGRITQAEADQIESALVARVTALVNGTPGFGSRGGRRFFGPGQGYGQGRGFDPEPGPGQGQGPGGSAPPRNTPPSAGGQPDSI